MIKWPASVGKRRMRERKKRRVSKEKKTKKESHLNTPSARIGWRRRMPKKKKTRPKNEWHHRRRGKTKYVAKKEKDRFAESPNYQGKKSAVEEKKKSSAKGK